MAVAQSPISNNTQSARWYRKAVTASVMEIHSLLWEHGVRIFSPFLSLSLLHFCSTSLILSLSVSVHLFVTLLSGRELRFPYLKQRVRGVADWTDKDRMGQRLHQQWQQSLSNWLSYPCWFMSVSVCDWFASLLLHACYVLNLKM